MTNPTSLPPTSNMVHLRPVEKSSPDKTPPHMLGRLEARYADPDDATVAATPGWYRMAVAARRRSLLGQAGAEDAA
jgi:hypothetical protein